MFCEDIGGDKESSRRQCISFESIAVILFGVSFLWN
jgi:hypothetical protein